MKAKAPVPPVEECGIAGVVHHPQELKLLSERVREERQDIEQMETYKRDNKHLAETLFSLMAVLEEKEERDEGGGAGGGAD